MKNSKRKKIFLDILLLIFIFSLIFSGYHIIKYYCDKEEIDDELEEIVEVADITEVSEDTSSDEEEETKNIEIITQEEEIPEENPYWDYIKMNLIDVKFDKLKKTNKNVKGWIKVNGTNVNYPFVQYKNNKYYLTHSFNNKYNYAGWVFLDYRNDISNFEDRNTIIYAHGMRNQTMFGSLKKIETNGWLKDSDNFIIKLSTEYENTLWQVFSIYHVPSTTDYLRIYFESDNDFQDFLDMIKNRSSYDFKTDVNASDRILTLSTCYTHTVKMVIHAKLIKREIKQDV